MVPHRQRNELSLHCCLLQSLNCQQFSRPVTMTDSHYPRAHLTSLFAASFLFSFFTVQVAAGISKGELLLGIGKESAANLSHDEAIERIRQPSRPLKLKLRRLSTRLLQVSEHIPKVYLFSRVPSCACCACCVLTHDWYEVFLFC